MEIESTGCRLSTWTSFARDKEVCLLCWEQKNKKTLNIQKFSQPCCLLLVIKPVVLQSPGFYFIFIGVAKFLVQMKEKKKKNNQKLHNNVNESHRPKSGRSRF